MHIPPSEREKLRSDHCAWMSVACSSWANTHHAMIAFLVAIGRSNAQSSYVNKSNTKVGVGR